MPDTEAPATPDPTLLAPAPSPPPPEEPAAEEAAQPAEARPKRGRSRLCPHCGEKLWAHNDYPELTKAEDTDCYHCDKCGCCLVADLSDNRPGHPTCTYLAARTAE